MALPRQQCSNSPRFILEVLNTQHRSRNWGLGTFQSILISISQHYMGQSGVRSKGCLGGLSTPRVQPHSLLSSAPQHFGVQQLLGHGQQIPARMAALEERWGKAGLKGHLVATKNLLRQPGDTSMAIYIIYLLEACSLHCDTGNALPQLCKKSFNCCISLPRYGKPPKAKKTQLYFGKPAQRFTQLY